MMNNTNKTTTINEYQTPETKNFKFYLNNLTQSYLSCYFYINKTT